MEEGKEAQFKGELIFKRSIPDLPVRISVLRVIFICG